jgi:hypothetical protein
LKRELSSATASWPDCTSEHSRARWDLQQQQQQQQQQGSASSMSVRRLHMSKVYTCSCGC